jgi:outer membrane protein OmpA-like peptidoglycan-associated protein
MMLPAIDFILILGVLIFGAVTVMAQALRSMSPAIPYVNAHVERLHSEASELGRLNRDGVYDPARLGALKESIPPPIPSELDVIRRLVRAGEVSVGNQTAMVDLARAGGVLWTEILRERAQAELEFWSERAGELCDGPPSAAPSFGAHPDRVDFALFLAELATYRNRVWRRYASCREPRTVVIDEELLHFRVDEADEFESDPRPALKTIMRLVDENLASHPRIYVLGHTDERASKRYNDHLSFRRALFVADQVRKHLVSRGLTEGWDYAIYPVGRGELHPVERLRGETTHDFWKRCRRIELSFRSAVKDPGAGERSL